VSKKQTIEIHNEEVREIMKEIPGSVIRWGNALKARHMFVSEIGVCPIIK
jgi:hypothetical protein